MNLPVLPRFSRHTASTFYDSTASEMATPPKFRRRRAFSVNKYAPAYAVHLAKERFPGCQCFYTLVDRRGRQHVYFATPAEAMNGRDGNQAVAGVVNLATWIGRVGRARQTAARRPPAAITSLAPRERIQRCVQEIQDVAESCLLTQAQFDHNGVEYFLEDLREHLDAMDDGFFN